MTAGAEGDVADGSAEGGGPAVAPRTRRRWPRVLIWIGASLLALVLVLVIAFQVSPWPSALVIRAAFDKGGHQANSALEPYTPDGVSAVLDQRYGDGGDTYLDVYYPTSAEQSEEPLPLIVWTHGGAWVSGGKDQLANYSRILAAQGYAVAAIDYSLAPGATYPTPVIQLNDALAYLQDNADRFHADAARIVLAGDSAGAQISAQLAAVVTSPGYAADMGIDPALPASDLAAVVLFCGAYDVGMVDLDGGGVMGWFLRSVLWAYSGSKDFTGDETFASASVARHVTAEFPPTFITGGNNDPLTEQGRALAERLGGLGVDVDELFFPDDYEPALGHEYQFDLTLDASQTALDRSIAFLTRVTR